MDTIKNLLIDSLNGFSPRFIPFFILQILASGFLAYITQRLVNWKFKAEIISRAAIYATGITLIVTIAKYSLPFSVLAAAAILLLGMKKDRSQDELIGLFLITVIAIGCGVGSVFLTALGSILLYAIIVILPLKKDA